METVLIITGGILGFALALPFLALALAKFNIFFTFIEEGRAKIILLNKQFYRAVMRYKGFYLSKNGEVKKDRRRKKGTIKQRERDEIGKPVKLPNLPDLTKKRERESLLLKIIRKIVGGGLVWVGIWPFYTAYTYKFRWQTLTRELDDKGNVIKKIKSHEEELDYVFVKSATYFAKLESAETEGLFPVSDDFIFTIRVTNPYKALFRAHQWFEFTIDMLLPHLREYQGGKSFEDLIKEPQLETGEMYKFLETGKITEDEKKRIDEMIGEVEEDEDKRKELEAKKMGVLGILKELFGISVAGVRIENLDPADERYKLALSKKFEAEQEVKRIKEVFGTIIEKYGDKGLIVRYLESIDKAGEKAGNWIIPFGARDLLGDLLGVGARERKGDEMAEKGGKK